MRKNTDAVIVMQPPNVDEPRNKFSGQTHEPMTLWIYFRSYWMDYLMMAILGGIALGVHSLHPAANRVFPVYFRNGEVVNPEFSYPLQNMIIPTWLSTLLAFLVPTVFILLMQIRVRSFNDINAGVMGLIYAVLCGSVFQVMIKWLIGGLRPHFYAVCKPKIDASSVGTGTGFDGLLFDRSICTGDEKIIKNALESMPSGHTMAAFASLLYLSLYLNGKLKIFANYRPQFWKLVLVFAPILGAVLIAGSLTIDHYHHWYDILAGATIGIMFAFGAYRFQYASVWDYRFNHIPLPRVDADQGFDYHLDHVHSALSGSRKGGWANEHMYHYGAPFDAMMILSTVPTDEQTRM